MFITFMTLKLLLGSTEVCGLSHTRNKGMGTKVAGKDVNMLLYF